MRAAAVVLTLLATFSPAAFTQESKDKAGRPPKKGDTITVHGCLTGSALEAAGLGSGDDAGALPGGVTFRLRGDRTLLKRLRDEHDRHVVSVKGVLKSDLPGENVPGRKVGNTRITIGTPAPSPNSPEAETRRAVPVLEVTSFEGSTATCGR